MTSNSRRINSSLNGCRGFTLIELVVVLLIMSVTAAVVVPRVGATFKRLEDGDFLREFTETIKRTRLIAISSGQPVAFRLNGNERVFGVPARVLGTIPENVEIFSEKLERDPATGDFYITFYPDGSLVGSNFDVVFDHARTYRVFIHPLVGTVTAARIEAK